MGAVESLKTDIYRTLRSTTRAVHRGIRNGHDIVTELQFKQEKSIFIYIALRVVSLTVIPANV